MARPEITGRKLVAGAEAEEKLPSIRGPPIAAYSIHEFCHAFRISVDHYYRLQRLGHGPDVMKVGTRTIISVEAASRWREQREAAAKKSNEAKEKEHAIA